MESLKKLIDGCNKSKLARDSGVSRRTIANIASGDQPTLTIATKLLDSLGYELQIIKKEK